MKFAQPVADGIRPAGPVGVGAEEGVVLEKLVKHRRDQMRPVQCLVGVSGVALGGEASLGGHGEESIALRVGAAAPRRWFSWLRPPDRPEWALMIDPAKSRNSMYALHGLLIQLRACAYHAERMEKIADVLDQIERLPVLIASPADETEAFEAALAALAAEHPEFGIGLARFRVQSIPHGW